MNNVKIEVTDVINSNIAISVKTGKVLFEHIFPILEKHQGIVLDFKGVTDLTTAFLNYAIGKLYQSFSSDELNNLITFENLSNLDSFLIQQVIERVKLQQENEEQLYNTLKENIDGNCT